MFDPKDLDPKEETIKIEAVKPKPSLANTTVKTASPNKVRKRFPRGLRITLKVMKFFLVPVLCLIALYAGLVIGYSKIGGQEAADILKLETWKHLYDLVFAE
ncbi:MAG TPA: DNA-directed RNA polymerase subunit beta [Bacilli bacterium]